MYKSQGLGRVLYFESGKPDVLFLPKTFEGILWNEMPGSFRKTTSGKVYDL